MPAKSVPVPSTVSPQPAKIIGMPLRKGWDINLLRLLIADQFKRADDAGAAGIADQWMNSGRSVGSLTARLRRPPRQTFSKTDQRYKQVPATRRVKHRRRCEARSRRQRFSVLFHALRAARCFVAARLRSLTLSFTFIVLMLLAALTLALVGALVAASTRPGSRLVALDEDHIRSREVLVATSGDAAGSDLTWLDGNTSSS